MNRNTRPAFALVAILAATSCATADNPQRLGGVTISGSVVFLDGNLSKAGDNGATSHQVPTNTPTTSVPVNTGTNGLANAAERVTRELMGKNDAPAQNDAAKITDEALKTAETKESKGSAGNSR